jgi:hypothetical protein
VASNRCVGITEARCICAFASTPVNHAASSNGMLACRKKPAKSSQNACATGWGKLCISTGGADAEPLSFV